MFPIKLKFQDCLSLFPVIGLSPTINSAMGTKVGPGLNDIGAEVEQYSQLIGNSLNFTAKAENPADDKEKEQTRKRAKRANQISRTVSKSAGLHPFFFDKFLVWSDYVEGRVNEEEFTERVREEVNIKAALLKN